MDDMGLVSAAVGMSQAKLDTQVQVLVAKKMLESEDEGGAAAVNLIQAADTGMDNAANQMIAATTGLGANLNVTA